MENRIEKLLTELNYLLNHAPTIDDCTDSENKMYSDMANLKESIGEFLCKKYEERYELIMENLESNLKDGSLNQTKKNFIPTGWEIDPKKYLVVDKPYSDCSIIFIDSREKQGL